MDLSAAAVGNPVPPADVGVAPRVVLIQDRVHVLKRYQRDGAKGVERQLSGEPVRSAELEEPGDVRPIARLLAGVVVGFDTEIDRSTRESGWHTVLEAGLSGLGRDETVS